MDRLKVSQIETSGGTQMRAKIDQAVVAAYREIIADLPPVDVFYDGTTYWLADGFHRYWAHHEEKVGTIDCRIHKGSKRDAILFAVAANAAHGLQRSDADKRNAVTALLNDEEWREWADREIARRCSVSVPLVGRIRKSICNSVTDAPAPDAKNAVSAPSDAPRKFKRAGKTHSQKPKKSAATPKEKPPADAPPEPPPTELKLTEPTDALGNMLPDRQDVRAAFAALPDLNAALHAHDQVIAALHRFFPTPAAARLASQRQRIEAGYKELRQSLYQHGPHALCPDCHGESKTCGKCDGTGWITREAWKRHQKATGAA